MTMKINNCTCAEALTVYFRCLWFGGNMRRR